MSFSQHNLWPILLVAAGLAGCAGSGEGLNSQGLPIGSSGGSGSGSGGSGGGSGGSPAEFDAIQQNVFTPICSPCHSGATAPEGMMLDAAHSYAAIVGVPSVENPALDRIKPGDPDSSYLVRKIQGGPGISGGQMPLHETPLPQSTIDQIRQWVTDGAPQGSSAATGSVKAMERIQALANTTSLPFAVTQTEPDDTVVTDYPVTHILVAFNHEVDASLVNYTTLAVDRVDPGVNDAGAPTAHLPSYASLAEGNPQAIVIKPAAPLLPGTYRVTVRGTGGGALADLNAQALGSDYSFTFTVDASP